MADTSTAAMDAAVNASSFQFTDADGNILILNTVLGTFEHAAHDGFANLMPEAMWLVGVFQSSIYARLGRFMMVSFAFLK